MALEVNHSHSIPKPRGNGKGGISLKNGKKPTRKQKIRIGQAGLSPDNWLVVSQRPNGELVLLSRHSNKIRKLSARND